MNQPVYVNRSMTIALVALLQLILPPLAVAASLYALTIVFAVRFDELFLALTLLAAVFTVLLLRVPVGNALALQPSQRWRVAGSLVGRWLLVLALLLALGYLSKLSDHFSRRVVLTWAALAPVLVVLVTFALQAAMRRVVLARENIRSAVIAGFNESSQELAGKISNHPELGLRVLGYFDDRSPERLGAGQCYPLLGTLGELADYVNRNGIQVIFVALPIRHVQRVRQLLDELRDTTVSLYYVPDLFTFDLIQSRTAEIMGIPVVSMRETPFYGYRGVLKRVTDVGFTLAILLAALPVMSLLALIIGITSKGPVIFRQRRYGIDGQEIVVYKFRSMYVTEDGQKIEQASKDDPRITPIGRFIRKFSLDELPQLFNVLQGRMSLVGPRPHAVAHNEEYRRLIKGYMIRHKVLPGITGLAQVNGCRGETRDLAQMERRVAYDLDYLRHWSPLLDLKILFLTVFRVFSDRNAY